MLTFGNLIFVLFMNFIYNNMYRQAVPSAVNKLVLSLNPGVGFFSLMDTQFGSSILSEVFNGLSRTGNMGLFYHVPYGVWPVRLRWLSLYYVCFGPGNAWLFLRREGGGQSDLEGALDYAAAFAAQAVMGKAVNRFAGGGRWFLRGRQHFFR